MIEIKKQHVFWLVVFILQVLFIAWYQGLLPQSSGRFFVPEPTGLRMSAAEAKLTWQAIELVQKDLESGSIKTAELARSALSAELPVAVRDRVLAELGFPDIGGMRDALEVLSRKIEVRL